MASSITAKTLKQLQVPYNDYDLAKLETELIKWLGQAFPEDRGTPDSLARLQTVLTLAASILYDVALERVTAAAGRHVGRGLAIQIFLDALEQAGWKRR
ncbi:hypothetical protein [Hyphomicrobium sp.]|jgi:hypothetical protein|uniref:hypothetical protein n=1 Tax=Hyphomicrobium sp. TaxID=82 RepID=UPI003566D312